MDILQTDRVPVKKTASLVSMTKAYHHLPVIAQWQRGVLETPLCFATECLATLGPSLPPVGRIVPLSGAIQELAFMGWGCYGKIQVEDVTCIRIVGSYLYWCCFRSGGCRETPAAWK